MASSSNIRDNASVEHLSCSMTASSTSLPLVEKLSRDTSRPPHGLASSFTAGGFSRLWEPDVSKFPDYAIEKFRVRVNDKFRLRLESYDDLYRWSITNFEEFWEEVWAFSEPVISKPHNRVLSPGIPMDKIPKWFLGCELNYAENLLKYRDDRPALYTLTEGEPRPLPLTFAQLYDQVATIAAALRTHGLRKGDRVAGYMPNSADTVAIMLAVASIGGVWSSTSPDFGVAGVLSRLSQVEPKFLFSVEAVKYNGQIHDNLEKLATISKSLPSVEKVIIVPYLEPNYRIDISNIQNGIFIEDFLHPIGMNGYSAPELVFEQVPFDHPLFIMFSSGTTGKPKCIVHSVGGTLIQHLKEMKLHFDVSRSDVMFYYTTAGWMMWNWELSCLALGCPVVLYDGSPFVPRDQTLWDLVDSLKITILGVSPKMLSIMETKGLEPARTHKLASLRVVLSTGSPLSPRNFDYVYRHVKRDVLLSSITGGTDIISLFGAGCVTLPVYRGQVQCRGLGMAVECFSEAGVPLRNEPGELVCTRPFPCMPVAFWNDPSGAKYRRAYFGMFKHVWAHGDFCMITSKPSGLVMMGRSDGTLNPGGVRFGSADIYNIVENFHEVEDSLCVAQFNSEGEERAVLFLKLAKGQSHDKNLVCTVKSAIKHQLSPRHVPAVILPAPDIPYTVNQKKVEVAVKNIISGMPLDEDAVTGLANPEALTFFRNIPDLQAWLETSLTNHTL